MEKPLAARIRSLRLGHELVLSDGSIICRFPDGEFKHSPHGAKGDLDTGCRWLDAADLEEEFGS